MWDHCACAARAGSPSRTSHPGPARPLISLTAYPPPASSGALSARRPEKTPGQHDEAHGHHSPEEQALPACQPLIRPNLVWPRSAYEPPSIPALPAESVACLSIRTGLVRGCLDLTVGARVGVDSDIIRAPPPPCEPQQAHQTEQTPQACSVGLDFACVSTRVLSGVGAGVCAKVGVVMGSRNKLAASTLARSHGEKRALS